MPWWHRKKEKDAEPVVQPPAVNNIAKATFKVSLASTNFEDGEASVRGLGEELREALVGDSIIASPYHWSGGAYYLANSGGEPTRIKVPYGWVGITNDAIISYTPVAHTAYYSDVSITIIAKDFQTLRSYMEKIIDTLFKRALDFKVITISI